MNKPSIKSTATLFIKSFLVLMILTLCFFFFIGTAIIEKKANAVIQSPPYKASQKAIELHKTLQTADLHADSLLWGRNLLVKSSLGHTDIPRLIEGNVFLQVFSVVSKTPRNLNIEQNDDKTDNIIFLAIANRWPVKTWNSLKERALYQASRIKEMSKNSKGVFVLIESKSDLIHFLERKKQEKNIVSGLLALEGAQVLEGNPANVDVLFAAGYRMMAPTHFFDTEMGGSAHGRKKGGLTDNGKEMIRRMEEKGMIVDLAHASKQTIDDILKLAKRPVVVSHTGVKGTCNNNRNLNDSQLKAIAANGGLIGIGFWETATCGTDAVAIANSIQYTANLIGVNHIALGSDFDGGIKAPFDTTGLILITDALIQKGFTEEEIRKIMGGNEIRFMLENLLDK